MAIRTPRLIQSRNGIYYFRYLRAPQPPQFPKRKEICVSLRTRNPIQARAIALFLNHIIESKVTSDIDRDLLQSLAAYASPYTVTIGRLTVEVRNNWDVANLNKTLKDPSNEFGKILRQAAKEESSEVLRQFDGAINAPMGAGFQSINVRKPFLDVIDLYLGSLPASGNSPATVKNKQTKLYAFYNWLREQGKLLPPGYPHEVSGVHVSEWINHYQVVGATGKRTGPKTIVGLYSLLQEFFEHCIAAQLCHSNPAIGFKSAKTNAIREAKAQRRSYEAIRIADIHRIFQPDLYFTCMSQADMFFGPLIAIFTGARREEIAGLKESDFYEETISNGKKIWVIKIQGHETDGRRLKNKNSERVVPICDALIESGLIDYMLHVRGLKQLNEPSLDLFPARKGAKRGNKLGEKFGQYLKLVGVKTGHKTECFHSLRHTAITNLVALSVSPQVSMKIVGHLAQNDLEKYGYQMGDASFSASVHHTSYDSSGEVGRARAHAMELPKNALDRLNDEFRLDTINLGKYAKQVIALTTRARNGQFSSGKRAPSVEILQRTFLNLENASSSGRF